MALDKVFEGLFENEDKLKESLISISPQLKGIKDDVEIQNKAFHMHLDEIQRKADFKKQIKAEQKVIKLLEKSLESRVIKRRKILNFDVNVKVFKTEVMVPFYELYDFDGKLLVRSSKIEMGISGFYYYYDIKTDEFVAIGYDEESKIIKEAFREKSENDLLLVFERKDKGRRFGFKKVPSIPKDFIYDTDDSIEQGS